MGSRKIAQNQQIWPTHPRRPQRPVLHLAVSHLSLSALTVSLPVFSEQSLSRVSSPRVAFSLCPGPSPPVHSWHCAPCPWLLFQTSVSWVPQTISSAPLRALSPHCCVILHSFSKGWPFPSLTKSRCPRLLCVCQVFFCVCVCQFLPLELAAPFFSCIQSTLVSTFCSSKHSLCLPTLP